MAATGTWSARSVRGVIAATTAATALVGAMLTVTLAGTHSTTTERLADGVVYRSDRVDGSRVHVVRLAAGARMRLGAVSANDVISGGRETVRSMARRTDALVAVNGDFFVADEPQGGVVSAHHLLRSPACKGPLRRPQLSVRPLWQSGCGFDWTGAIQLGDTRLRIDQLNRAPVGKGLAVYDTNWGAHATPRRHGFEVVLKMAKPRRAGAVGRDIRLTWDHRGRARGGTTAGRGELVVSAAGREARVLRRLWHNRRHDPAAALRLDLARRTADSVGCRPRLLSDGRRVPLPDGPFARGRHARTALGWDRAGRRWIVTVDQGNGSTGWSLRQLTTYLQDLGATDACNLDGGGSATMVVRGDVVNDPSDGWLRPVVNAVVLTTAPPRKNEPAGPGPQPPAEPNGVIPTAIPTILPTLPAPE
jgi:hypothetical protein